MSEPTGGPDPDAPRTGTNISYIPALDGIRGLAMLVIMGYHAGVFLTAGGFYSLDTFFALSGFLITTLLIAEWQRKGAINLGLFWARRARRLIPGLLMLLVAVSLYETFVVPRGTYPDLRLDALSSLLYVANWHFILEGSNYFNQTGLVSPLLHTWSLAVEEQFYLVWPLVVLVVMRLTKSLRALLAVAAAGMVGSALEMALLFHGGASINRLYYGTDTRAQSLLAGATLAALLAVYSERRHRLGPVSAPAGQSPGGDPAWATRTPRTTAVVAGIGLVGIVGSALLWTKVTSSEPFAYEGGFLLAALSTTAMLYSVVCAQRSPVARLLSFSPLRYLGRISYGMYLVHFPLFDYLDSARVGVTGWPLFGVRAAATVVLATASFYGIERPIRQGNFFKVWRAWLLTPVAMVVTGAVVIAGTIIPTAALAVTGPKPGSSLYQGKAVNVLLVGDSDALTLGIGLNHNAFSYDVVLEDEGILGCGVINGEKYISMGQTDIVSSYCNPAFASTTEQWYDKWKGWVAQYKPNVVMILAGRWEVLDRYYDGQWTNIFHKKYAAYVKHQLGVAVGIADAKGAHVDLLTAPCYDDGEAPNGDPWPENNPTRVAAYNKLVRQVAAEHPATVSVIDLNTMVCPGGKYTQYLHGIEIRWSDGIHFSLQGGEYLEPKIWPTVVEQGRQQMKPTSAAR